MTAAAAPDPLAHGWWLASRASGVVALALVTASTLLGLAMATKLLRRRGLPPVLAALHEQLAVTGLVAIAVHGVTLLGDPWLRPGLAGIALPGAMAYRPLFTSLGIVAGWLTALLGLSYYARRRIGARRWRSVHRFTVVAYALAVVHTLGAGTDAGSAWLRIPLLASAALAAALLAVRVVRPRSRPRPSPQEDQPSMSLDRVPPRSRVRRWAPRVVFALVAAFALIQLVPYGRAHDNPPVRSEPRWDSPRTKQLFAQACGACHSNLTDWPWYSDVAPVSWLVQHDVEDGRARFNVSEWRRQAQPEAGEAAEVVRSGEMPPLQFRAIHAEARLSSAEKAALAAGLARTFANSPPLRAAGDDGDDG